ncbi:MAG: TrkH family potassium uptake protein [Ruminococcaceae bacterium]|nr:TrkH family potassium uptake protein [Oscillospiraceae bacterium]
MNYRMIGYTLGWVLNIEAICLMLSAVTALVYGEIFYLKYIALCIGACVVFGVALTHRAPKNKAMYAKEGFVTVALSWIVISIFGALPFFLSGAIPDFIDAFFETVSGFTTTGASILRDVEALPKCLIFWRSFTHFIGGMGVLVFLVALLPLSGGSNLYLIKAESPGPSVSKIVPKVRQTAKIFYGIYISLTLLQVILLLLGGMDLFEALTLSFGTAGTGGFSILNSGISTYSPYVQWVITIFMVIFGVDFSLYYLILTRRVKDAMRSEEFRAYMLIIISAVAVIVLNCRHLFAGLGEALRHSAFQVASIMTTTGYATTDFDLWPQLSKTILVVLMFIGACAGSTGGGIKVSRILIMLKSIGREIKVAAHPKATAKITMNSRLVEHETVRSVNVYIGIMSIIFFSSLLVVSIDNMDFTTNFTAVAATINNIGPGFAGVGPTRNFADYSMLSKIVFSINMLIGRLEIYPMLLLLVPRTWKR